MTNNYDLIADVLGYVLQASIAYVFFIMSQSLRVQYIEVMSHLKARLIFKLLEYLALFVSGLMLLQISHFHHVIFYLSDFGLFGLFVRQFIKTDQFQRSEYLRHYNYSKSKLMTHLIMNLIHYPMHHDN